MQCTLPAFSCCRPNLAGSISVSTIAPQHQSLLTFHPFATNPYMDNIDVQELPCVVWDLVSIRSPDSHGDPFDIPMRYCWRRQTLITPDHICCESTHHTIVYPRITTRRIRSLPLQRQVTLLAPVVDMRQRPLVRARLSLVGTRDTWSCAFSTSAPPNHVRALISTLDWRGDNTTLSALGTSTCRARTTYNVQPTFALARDFTLILFCVVPHPRHTSAR
jgi:hypothetical protein